MIEPTSEFSRKVDIRDLGVQPLHLTATRAECEALARRFGIVAVLRLDADVRLEAQGHMIEAIGELTAEIVQSCAVSSEDFPVAIREPLALRFISEDRTPTPAEDLELTAEDCDEIGFTGTSFDLGEQVAQSLALAIDPFAVGPKAEEARRAAGILDRDPANPFSSLAALRKQLD